MGLRTTNYKTKQTQIFLPEAYAVVKALAQSGDMCVATLVVHQNREMAIKARKNQVMPLDEVTIRFANEDLLDNPIVLAYNEASSIVYVDDRDPITGKAIKKAVPRPFHGWETDMGGEIHGFISNE